MLPLYSVVCPHFPSTPRGDCVHLLRKNWRSERPCLKSVITVATYWVLNKCTNTVWSTFICSSWKSYEGGSSPFSSLILQIGKLKLTGISWSSHGQWQVQDSNSGLSPKPTILIVLISRNRIQSSTPASWAAFVRHLLCARICTRQSSRLFPHALFFPWSIWAETYLYFAKLFFCC